jgi:hypothetical protein
MKQQTYGNRYLCWISRGGHICLDQIVRFVIAGTVAFFVTLDIFRKNIL